LSNAGDRKGLVKIPRIFLARLSSPPSPHVLDKSAFYGKGISPTRILLANSLRLLPLHCVERAGVRPPPFGYC